MGTLHERRSARRMLTGGIDSSPIAGVMEQISQPVKTFSVAFAERDSRTSSEDARSGGPASSKPTITSSSSPSSTTTVDLEDLVWQLDEPLADLSALGFHALSGLAAQHVTVALSGEGADELFGGYRKHQAASLIGQWQRLPESIPTEAGELLAPHTCRGVSGVPQTRSPHAIRSSASSR